MNGGGGSGQTAPVMDFGTPAQEQKRKDTPAAYDELVKKILPVEKKFRDAAATKDKDGNYASTLPALIESALRKGPNDRADQNYDELTKHYKDKEPEYVKLLGELRKAKQARDAANAALPKVMVMGDQPTPRDTFILTRGDYSKKEGKVLPGAPGFLNPGAAVPGLTGAMQNRLSLANWIASTDNPLTARVTVNRLWQMFFGTGLVKTSEDFGVQGERPSHPELLDWLAVEFAEKWDTKHVIRLIVTSATYRQSAKVTPELLERDPENRLLARGPRYRLPSWMIRDQALAASGLLTPTYRRPAGEDVPAGRASGRKRPSATSGTCRTRARRCTAAACTCSGGASSARRCSSTRPTARRAA